MATIGTSETGLIGYWKLEENAGTSTVDSTGSGFTGTLQGSTNPTWTTGKIGNGLSFTAGDLSLGNLGLGSTFSFSCWIKPSALTGGNADQQNYGYTICASSNASPNYGIWLTAKGTELRVMTYSNSLTLYDTSGANLSVGSWFHVVVTATKGGNTQVYVNGISKLSRTNDGASNWTSTFNIGDLRAGRAIYFSGEIDEIKMYNRILSQSEVTSEYNKTINNFQISLSEPNLVGYWKLENNVLDSSGQGNTGALYGTSYVNGKIGRCLDFNGSSDYVDMGNSSTLNTSYLTVCFWVYPRSFSSHRAFLTRRETTSTGHFFIFQLNGNDLTFDTFADGSQNRFSSGYNTPLSTWTHIACTYDGTKKYIYVNGNIQAGPNTSDSGAMSSTTSSLYIGRDTTASQYYFDGLIDEVRIYNKALTQEEITVLYNSTSNQFKMTL